MPRTKFHRKGDSELPEVDPQDLSYQAMWRRRQVEQMQVERGLENKIDTINTHLKSDRVGVTLNRQGDLVYLVATLPVKPGDTHPQGRKHKQYKVSVHGTGFTFSVDGLNEAEKEARDLGLLKTKGLFQWTERYLGKKTPQEEPTPQKPKTIGEMLEEFEQKYFRRRNRKRKSERTFCDYIYWLKRFLPVDKVLTEKVMLDALHQTEPQSKTRWYLAATLSVFCNTIKFKHDIRFGEYKTGYSPKQREIPSDEEIEQDFYAFKPRERKEKDTASDRWAEYQWHYGVMAAWGVRPEETFAIDFEKTCAPTNTRKLLYLNEVIVDGLKTGNRVVFPLHKKWVEQFDLMNPKPLKHRTTNLKTKVDSLSKAFKRYGISFVPYDLRHAFAIRGHVLGIPVNEMAKNMGHSWEMQVKTYQKWLKLANRIELWDKMEIQMEEQSELERVKAELEAVKEELMCERTERIHLQAENQRLYTQYQQLHQDFVTLAAFAEHHRSTTTSS